MKRSAVETDKHCLTVREVDQERHQVSDVDRAMTKGALWMILARLSDRSLGFVSTIILVRILTPADFGIVAMATSVIAICELLGQVGLDVVLIQNPSTSRRHYDTAWTFSIIIAAIIAVLLVLIAVPVSHLYGEPRLLPILLSLAAGSLISGFENIGIVAFRRELQFKKEFQYIFGKKIVGFFFTIVLAFILRSYSALIAGMVISRLAGVCLSYYVQEYRPRWSLEARADLFHFSKWLVISNFVTVTNSRAADFIVGKFAGAHALGIFSVSYEMSNLPTSELIAPINRAVFPGYARKSADPNALREGYLNVIAIIAGFGIPAAFGIAATSHSIVTLFLGDQWLEAIPLVSILAFYGVLAAMKTNAHYIYLALGRPQVATYLGVLQISILLPMLAFSTARNGAMGAAYAYLVSQAIFTPISFAVLFRVLGIGKWQLFLVVWRPIVSAMLMYITIRLGITISGPQLIDTIGNFAHLLYAITVGIITYSSCLYLLWTMAARPLGAESQLLGFVQSTSLWSRFKSSLDFQ